LIDVEIITGHEGVKEAAWIEKVTNDFSKRGSKPYVPTLYCDSVAAMQLMKDMKFYAKAKHIEIRYFYIRNDIVQRNRLQIQLIPSKEQVTDILTK
jgi:hypothetical protein